MSSIVENDSFNPDIRNVSAKGTKNGGVSNNNDSTAKGAVDKVRDVLMLRRTKWTLGVVIGFFGVFLLLSCISFFMQGAADQSEVMNTAVASQSAENINNRGAIFGAYLSHLFIEQGVGLAAFIVVAWCFVIALRLLKGGKVFFVQFTFLSLLSIFACSMVAGAITYNLDLTFFPIGGNIGYYLNTLLIDYTRIYGMIMVNFVIAMVWVFVFYNTLKSICDYTSGVIKRSRRVRTGKPGSEPAPAEVPLSDFMGDSNAAKRPASPSLEDLPVSRPVTSSPANVTEPAAPQAVKPAVEPVAPAQAIVGLETEKPQETEPAPEEQKTESEQKKASPLPMIMLLLFVIGAAGVGGYLYIKMKGVKPASKKNQPDPHADYHDEDEDALQLPEDDGDEDEEVDVNEDYEAESYDEPV